MNSIKIILSVFVLLLLSPLAASAQEPSTTKKQELIRELLVVIDAKNNATKILNSYVDAMEQQYPQIVERLADADPDLTPAQRKRVIKTLNEKHAQYSTQLMERIRQRVDVGTVMENISGSLFDKFYTEEEIRDIITFYKTPTGKKTLSIMPQLFAESVRRASEDLMPILTTIVTEMAEEEKERLKHIK